jgi:hypothetical protein
MPKFCQLRMTTLRMSSGSGSERISRAMASTGLLYMPFAIGVEQGDVHHDDVLELSPHLPGAKAMAEVSSIARSLAR